MGSMRSLPRAGCLFAGSCAAGKAVWWAEQYVRPNPSFERTCKSSLRKLLPAA
jgi:hypothetical protein